MKPRIFTTADYARVYDSKLVILGAFDTIRSPQFPFAVPFFVIVGKIMGEKKDRGKTYTATFKLRKRGTRKTSMEAEVALKFVQTGHDEPLPCAYLVITATLTTFNSPGTFVAELLVNGEVLCEDMFWVVSSAKAPPSKLMPKPVKPKAQKKTSKKTPKKARKQKGKK